MIKRRKALPLTRRDLERCAAAYDIPFRAVEIAIKRGELGKGGKVTLTDFDKWRKARAV